MFNSKRNLWSFCCCCYCFVWWHNSRTCESRVETSWFPICVGHRESQKLRDYSVQRICWFQRCIHRGPHFSSTDGWALGSWVCLLLSQGIHRARKRKAVGSEEASIFLDAWAPCESSVCRCWLSRAEKFSLGSGFLDLLALCLLCWYQTTPDIAELWPLVMVFSFPEHYYLLLLGTVHMEVREPLVEVRSLCAVWVLGIELGSSCLSSSAVIYWAILLALLLHLLTHLTGPAPFFLPISPLLSSPPLLTYSFPFPLLPSSFPLHSFPFPCFSSSPSLPFPSCLFPPLSSIFII